MPYVKLLLREGVVSPPQTKVLIDLLPGILAGHLPCTPPLHPDEVTVVATFVDTDCTPGHPHPGRLERDVEVFIEAGMTRERAGRFQEFSDKIAKELNQTMLIENNLTGCVWIRPVVDGGFSLFPTTS